jgi:hypothetical protein
MSLSGTLRIEFVSEKKSRPHVLSFPPDQKLRDEVRVIREGREKNEKEGHVHNYTMFFMHPIFLAMAVDQRDRFAAPCRLGIAQQQ